MEYWIDGYNLLFKIGMYTKTLEQSRKSLIGELRLHLIKSNLRAKIIFDSSEAHGSEFPSVTSTTPLEIIFAPAKLSADDYIIEMLEHSRSARNTTIVTNDSQLSFRAKGCKAFTLSIDEFFKLVFTKEDQKQLSNYEFLKEKGGDFKNSEESIQLFIKIFEERLDRNT